MKLGMICLEGSSPLILFFPHCGFTNALWTPRRLCFLTHTLATWEEGLSPSAALALPPAPVPGLPFPGGWGVPESQLLLGSEEASCLALLKHLELGEILELFLTYCSHKGRFG